MDEGLDVSAGSSCCRYSCELMMKQITKCGISLEPSPEIVQPEVQPLQAEVMAEEEVATDVVSEVSSVEPAEALEGKEAEEMKVKVSGTKMEVAPMKPEVTEVEQVTEEVKEEAPKGKTAIFFIEPAERTVSPRLIHLSVTLYGYRCT